MTQSPSGESLYLGKYEILMNLKPIEEVLTNIISFQERPFQQDPDTLSLNSRGAPAERPLEYVIRGWGLW